MKKIISFFAVAALMTGWLNAQQPAPAASINPRPRTTATAAQAQEPEPLRRFDLDFPGGTPGELVKAIEKANNHPLNAIIPPQYADTEMPPLKLKSITVPELFSTLTRSSQKIIYHRVGPSYQSTGVEFGFKTTDDAREDSIWYFYHSAPALQMSLEPIKGCRFFQLEPYLETYKVEDITTAIETGWKMLGYGRGPAFSAENTAPEISYHKDTKLLIAVGDPDKLKLIDSVLEQLPKKYQFPQRGLPPPTPVKRPSEATNSGATDKK